MHETPPARYRVHRFYRLQVLAMFAVFAAVSIWMLSSVALGRSGDTLFELFWLAAVAWNAYWFLFRFVHELELQESELVWSAPLRSGSVPLTELVQVRPMRLGWGVHVIEHRDGRPLLVWATGGLKPFLDRVGEVAPGVDVRVGWSVRTAARASERLDRLERAKQRRLLMLLVVVLAVSLVAFVFGTADSATRSDAIRRRSVRVEGEILRFTHNLRGGREAVVRYRVGDRELENETTVEGFDAGVG